MQPIDILYDLVEMVAFLSLVTLLVMPLGAYMARVFQGERTFMRHGRGVPSETR